MIAELGPHPDNADKWQITLRLNLSFGVLNHVSITRSICLPLCSTGCHCGRSVRQRVPMIARLRVFGIVPPRSS